MTTTTGRPEIGGTISTAIGAARLARVDQHATATGTTRAEAIRALLDQALAATDRSTTMTKLTAADVRKLWTGQATHIGNITADDLYAVTADRDASDTDDQGQPTDTYAAVVARQLNGE